MTATATAVLDNTWHYECVQEAPMDTWTESCAKGCAGCTGDYIPNVMVGTVDGIDPLHVNLSINNTEHEDAWVRLSVAEARSIAVMLMQAAEKAEAIEN